MAINFHSIATIRSGFKSRNAIPRQAQLVPGALSAIEFPANTESRQLVRGLQDFSHIWVLFLFHGNPPAKKSPVVHPPRQDKLSTKGALATRSPYRPNPIGMSVVKLLEKRLKSDFLQIIVEGGDFLDGTPVIDLKPYVPYADCRPEATAVWADHPTPALSFSWTRQAEQDLETLGAQGLKTTLEAILAQDPRPFHHRTKPGQPDSRWNFNYENHRIIFSVHDFHAQVLSVQ